MTFTAAAVREEMRGHIGSLVALAPEDSRKTALAYAAKLLRLPFGRVRSLYYGGARRIDAHEADQIRAYVQAAEKLIKARADYNALRQQFLSDAHPSLARFAPGKLAEDQVSREAAEVVSQKRAGR